MRTPGHDEELALGFLHGEGLLAPAGAARRAAGRPGRQRRRGRRRARRGERGRVAALLHDVVVRGLREGRAGGGRGPRAAAARRPRRRARAAATLPGRLRQPGFEATGGLHATGLFTPAGELRCVREDVGRHNAMDKVVGRALLDGALPLHDLVLCVSGRLSFELVQKAAVAGRAVPRRRRRADLARRRPGRRPGADAVRLRPRRARERLHAPRAGPWPQRPTGPGRGRTRLRRPWPRRTRPSTPAPRATSPSRAKSAASCCSTRAAWTRA